MTVTTSTTAVSIVCLSSIAGWSSWRSSIFSAPPTSGLDFSLLVKTEARLEQLDQPLVLAAKDAQVMGLTVWIAIAMLTAILGVFLRYAMYQPPQLQPPGVEVGTAGLDGGATGRHAVTTQSSDKKYVAATGEIVHVQTLLEMELPPEPHSQESEAEVCREVNDTPAQGMVGLGTLAPADGDQSLVQMLLERELELALGRKQDSDSRDGESSSNEGKDTLSTASASGAASEDAESTSNESGPSLRCRHSSPYVSIQDRKKQHEIELDGTAQKFDVDASKDVVTFVVLGTMCSLPRVALDCIERAGFDVSFTEDDCVSTTVPGTPRAHESTLATPRVQEVCREVNDGPTQGIVGLGSILPLAAGEQSLVQMLLEQELELALGRKHDSDSRDDGERSSNEDKDTLSTSSASDAASEDAESTSNESEPSLRCGHSSPYVPVQDGKKQHEIELDGAAQKIDVNAQKNAITFAVLERAGFAGPFTEADCVSTTLPETPRAHESILVTPRVQEVIGDWMGRRRTLVPQLVRRIAESDQVPHAHAVEEACCALNYISF